MEGCKRTLLYVVNVDSFFISHRLPLAVEAIRRGYNVYVLTRNTGKRNEIESYGIHFVEIPFQRSGTNPFHELQCVFQLFKFYKRLKPDIIHHITLKASLLGSIAAKLSGKYNVVNAISGLGYNFTEGRNGIVQQIVRFLVKTSFKSKYFRFILQNNDDVSYVKSFKLVPDNNVFLIKGSGVNLNEYAYSDVIQKDKLIVLFPARILLDKGVIEFINSAKGIKSKYSDKVRFVLAGDCDKDNPTVLPEDKLKHYLIDGYIDWIGFQKKMYPIYRESDIVVLPSYREGLPKSLIDACAVGRPIITTDVPGCKECVVDGYNGFLVPQKDSNAISSCLVKLLEDKELRLKFGVNSRKLAEKEFSIVDVVKKTFNIYDSL